MRISSILIFVFKILSQVEHGVDYKNKQGLAAFTLIMVMLGALILIMLIIILSLCCLRKNKTVSSSGAVAPAANIQPPEEQILAAPDYAFK